MVGLYAGTHSRLVVVGGILTIAIADACSDALGIHVSEEAENVHTEMQIWVSTISTFLTKFFFALTFLIPLFICSLDCAIIISLIWGMSILAVFSYVIAKSQQQNPAKVIAEHLLIGFAVVAITHFVGVWIAGMTG